jgi:xanthine dehydrogenase small subunit
MPRMVEPVQMDVNGALVAVDASGSLLDALRSVRPALVSVKDGCAPQGQCGCCTVLVDGEPRVACVTPARRVAGRAISTLEGLAPEVRDRWVEAFVACGASQCGFCTPGIVVRCSARAGGTTSLDNALAAHLCRCTGWQTIREAVELAATPSHEDLGEGRDLTRATLRATVEGRSPQKVGPEIVLGRGGFAIDTVPEGARYAVPAADGGWVLGDTLAEARRNAGKVQGRRTTITPEPPLAVPAGEWAVTLRTSWVEPAYLEPDVSWCEPGGEPATPLANGGAFGAKRSSVAPEAARELAEREGRTVCVVLAREDTVRRGPKRPPVALGVRADGTGVVHVARTPGIAEAITAVAPGLEVVEVDLAGPPTSDDLRAAGWAEAAVAVAAATGADEIEAPDGGVASAEVRADGSIAVRVRCGEPLDAVVLRSYCIGAAHMAYSWVTSEQLTVDETGAVHDLTIRSFDIVKAADTPRIDVTIEPDDGPPVNGSDAVFAAVALAVWRARSLAPSWPTG